MRTSDQFETLYVELSARNQKLYKKFTMNINYEGEKKLVAIYSIEKGSQVDNFGLVNLVNCNEGKHLFKNHQLLSSILHYITVTKFNGN